MKRVKEKKESSRSGERHAERDRGREGGGEKGAAVMYIITALNSTESSNSSPSRLLRQGETKAGWMRLAKQDNNTARVHLGKGQDEQQNNVWK